MAGSWKAAKSLAEPPQVTFIAFPCRKSIIRGATNAALSGNPTPTPIAASLVEKFGHEADGGLFVACTPATPPAVAEQLT